MTFQFNSISEASLLIECLEAMEQECDQTIDQLLVDFNVTHSDPPARIVRVKNRVLAWRFKARIPKEQGTFVFTGAVGQTFVATLSPLVQQSFREFEKRRLDICARKKCVAYQKNLIRNWVKARKALQRSENSRSRK